MQIACLFLCLSLGLSSIAAQDSVAPNESGFDPAAALIEAARLPASKDRSSAVKALVKRRDVSLEQWLEVMGGLNTAMDVKQGVQAFTPVLELDGRKVMTELEVYVPSSYQGKKATPLLLLLHGSGGNGKQLISSWRSFAERNGYLLCAPTDPDSSGGYAFTAKERDSGMEALRWMRSHFFIDSDRVHLHGVSRGGHMAWDLAARYPDHFATVVPAIGGPTWVVNEGRNNMRLVENLWATPIRDLQGALDDERLLKNLHITFDRIKAAGNQDAELIEFPDLGHTYRISAVDWQDFFTTRSRTPSASSMSTVDFSLAAGSVNAGRDYVLLGTKSGIDPGTVLTGGQWIPLNFDSFTGRTRSQAGSGNFVDFVGQLDADGNATAMLRTHNTTNSALVGRTLHFVFVLRNAQTGNADFASNPVPVEILP